MVRDGDQIEKCSKGSMIDLINPDRKDSINDSLFLIFILFSVCTIEYNVFDVTFEL